MKPLFVFAALLCASSLFGGEIEEIESKYSLPDYSFAGYKKSEHEIPRIKGPIFDVTDYGAVADDGVSDRKSIQNAIDAAEGNGGGVVFFPSGQFRINGKDDLTPLKVGRSNIVLRGSGSENGETVLFMEQALAPPPPIKLWASPYAIQVSAPSRSQEVSPITKNVASGEREIWVKDGSALQEGQWVILSLLDNSPELVKAELHGFQEPNPAWTSIWEEGVDVAERHQIESVHGNRIVLTTPVIKAIDSRYDWNLKTYKPLSGIGIEKLRFKGNWKDRFVHHRSWLDDGGYSLLKIQNVVNSWVRDCVFESVNRGCSITASAHVSVLDSRLEGTPGHNAINFSGSSYCLMARVEDRASQWHSLGVSNTSIGNVIWKCFWNSNTCFESHSSQPRHTLIDSCVGGFMKGHGGGARKNLPTHLRGLVVWNHLKTNPELRDFQFEPIDEMYWRVLQPLIVGMHGTCIMFREGQSDVVSLGEPLGMSLYEYQVRRRLKELPIDLGKAL